MTEELTLQLKDAGLPISISNTQYFPPQPGFKYKEKYYLIYPTLSELIDACGGRFAELSSASSPIDHPWTASGRPIRDMICGHGETKEEAVANLWLVLNKK